MTAPATVRRAGPFNGNGATTSFPFTYKVFAASDVEVTFGVDTVLALGVDYSVALNADQDSSPGGTITYPISGAPLAVGQTLVAIGALPYDQTADLPSGGNYRAVVVENALDRAVMQIQQLAEAAERSIRAPSGVVLNVLQGDPGDFSGYYLGIVAGQPAYLLAPSGTAAAVAGDLASTASGKGDALVAVKSTLTGGADRTQHNKNADVVSVNDFTGTDPTGATGSGSGINAALASGAGLVTARGTFLLDADLLLPDNVIFDCRGATFLASANGRTMIKSTGAPSSYYSQIWGGVWDGNGKTGVTAMDLSNMRIGAGLFSPRWKDCNIGLISRNGMFGAVIDNPGSERVPYPVQVLANASAMVIRNPAFDNSPSMSGTGLGIGIDVRAGAADNIGVRVEGGYVQGFDVGVKDAAIKTVVDAVYIELCTTADIEGAAARASNYARNTHYGPSGAAGYKLRNCDAVMIDDPTMASGARTGLFDADGTNTNCTARMSGSNAALNTPLGTVTGLFLTDYTLGFTAADASGAGLTFTANSQAYRTGHGLRVTLDVDITYPATASGATAAVTLPIASRSGSVVSGVCGFTDYGAAVFLRGSGSTVNFYTAAGAALTNANLTGRRLAFSLSYLAQ